MNLPSCPDTMVKWSKLHTRARVDHTSTHVDGAELLETLHPLASFTEDQLRTSERRRAANRRQCNGTGVTIDCVVKISCPARTIHFASIVHLKLCFERV